MKVTNSDKHYPFLQGGGEMGELTRHFDWSKTALGTPDQWPQSLRTIVGVLLHSRFPMFLFWGPELVCFYNDAYRPSLGNDGKHPSALGEPGARVWAETWPIIKPLIDKVLAGGEASWSEDQLIPIYRNGQLEDVYWTFSYSPAYGDQNEIAGVFVTCTETTRTVLGRQKAEEIQRQVLTSFEVSPVAIAIVDRADLVFQMANPFYGYLVGRKPEQLVGQSFLDALPELQGQGFDGLMREVAQTGKPYMANEVSIDIMRNNRLETIYVDLTYQPQREADNRISGILVVATDVTQQVVARRHLEETHAQLIEREAHLNLLSNTVPAMIFYLDKEQRYQSYNLTFMNWFKVSAGELRGKTVREFLGETTYRQVAPHLAIAYAGRSEVFEMQAPTRLGEDRWLHMVYTPHKSQDGTVLGIIALATDITFSKQTEKALEQLVRQRTEELAAANEELAANNEELEANNEEYAAINEELEQANGLLLRSNENLQQFAYVASHDLQEPLRKIQQFGDLLKTRYASASSEEHVYLDRMQSAANRMSILIRDLLNFSRLSTQRDTSDSVSLDEVVNAVVAELDLRIQESGASIQIDHLPTIAGDPMQLQQLFQNLIGNALKFHQPGFTPVIRITVRRVEAVDLPASVKPSRISRQYYRIDVRDNGIGFDEKYQDRIFQVFQRLHNRSEFAGTGIGLAICKRVAVTHGGDITASSQPGRGATFSVYLPV
ncbi:PAS domain-containing sensor histidine kinase [Spirosoma koreense]